MNALFIRIDKIVQNQQKKQSKFVVVVNKFVIKSRFV